MGDVISNIIKRQRQELSAQAQVPLVPRTLLPTLRQALSSRLVKAITGPRRAGKSTLALQALHGSSFAYFNFEDEGLPLDASGQDIIQALEQEYGKVDYYLFDEIQYLSRWEQFINRLHRLQYNLVITGSNSRLLSSELSSALTGRHVALELFPFGCTEACPVPENLEPRHILPYLINGGFPEVVLGRADSKSYLATLWDSIILKDIAARKNVRNITALRELFSLFLSSIACRYSAESLARCMNGKISAPTVRKFLEYGVEAFLISELLPFYAKPRRRIKSDRKAYVIDNGFFSARQIGVLEDHGRLLENLVFVELWRRGHRPNLDLFYYVTKGNHEVDFLVRDGHRNLELIQASISLGNQKTKERELRALANAAQELKVSKLTVVTLDQERIEKLDAFEINIKSVASWCGKE